MDEDTRFRRALKSPLVMVGLCLLAGIAVYHNVIESTMDSSLPISVASTLAPTASAPTTSTASLMGHDELGIVWIDNPKRDPFAPLSGDKGVNLSSQQPSASATLPLKSHESSPGSLTLKAIAIEAKNRSAVINRQVVHEGEMVEGYQVVSIQLKGVLLTRHGKKRFLTFTTNPTS